MHWLAVMGGPVRDAVGVIGLARCMMWLSVARCCVVIVTTGKQSLGAVMAWLRFDGGSVSMHRRRCGGYRVGSVFCLAIDHGKLPPRCNRLLMIRCPRSMVGLH